MRKADCTPEEWAAYLKKMRTYYSRNIEKMRTRAREYHSRPEVKARRKKRQDTPEAAARRREFNKTDEAKRRRKEAYAKLKADPEKLAKVRDKVRQLRTGFTRDDILELTAFQKNRCAICERSFETQQMRADHCHETGSPRGLLCHHCNILEGMLRGLKLTPEEFATKIRAYLNHPPYLLLKRQS
jgi:hypothetical protein